MLPLITLDLTCLNSTSCCPKSQVMVKVNVTHTLCYMFEHQDDCHKLSQVISLVGWQKLITFSFSLYSRSHYILTLMKMSLHSDLVFHALRQPIEVRILTWGAFSTCQ